MIAIFGLQITQQTKIFGYKFRNQAMFGWGQPKKKKTKKNKKQNKTRYAGI